MALVNSRSLTPNASYRARVFRLHQMHHYKGRTSQYRKCLQNIAGFSRIDTVQETALRLLAHPVLDSVSAWNHTHQHNGHFASIAERLTTYRHAEVTTRRIRASIESYRSEIATEKKRSRFAQAWMSAANRSLSNAANGLSEEIAKPGAAVILSGQTITDTDTQWMTYAGCVSG